jgi:hypothetical protein
MFFKKFKNKGLCLFLGFLIFGCASEKRKELFRERDEVRREDGFIKGEETLPYWPEILDQEEEERTREEERVEEIESDFGSTEDAEELTEIDEIETSDEVEAEVEEKEEEIAQPKWDWLGYLDYPQEVYVSQEVEEGGEIKHDLSGEDFVSRDFTQEDGSNQELPEVFLDYLEGAQSDREQEKDSSQDFPEESGFENEEVPQEAEVNEPSLDLSREQYQSDDFNLKDSVFEDVEEDKESDQEISNDFGLETQSEEELEEEVKEEESDLREEVCQPDCDSKECGDDGCGGICGACDDGISCTVDYCDDFQCHFAPLDSLCSDNLDCTVDKCTPSGCQNIPDDSRCGFSEYCWPWKGGCVYVECFSDDDCLDDNLCNGIEQCDVLTYRCLAGIALECDDGLWCNGFETCNPLLGCQAGIPPILSDGINCTIDFCDEENDKIVHLPDDSLCDDHNPCTLDFCNVLLGCQHFPKDSDQDGFIDANCPLGSDCNDNDSSINPAVQDTVGDGVDQNCDGLDGVDADHDGYPSIDSGGSDCDDNNPLINPGQAHDPIEVRVEENVELDQNIGVAGTQGEASIVVDSQGYPHIVWECEDNGTGVCFLAYSELRYIERSSAGWSPIYLIYGFAAQVLLDPQENVHIIYLTLDRGYCFNRWRKLRSDGSWLYDRLFCENDGWVGFHSEVFDSQGYLHIAYQDDLNTILTYATNVSGSWVVTDIDDGNEKKANAGNDPLIVLDSRGKVHIVSVLSGTVFDTEVRYSTNESGSWTTRTLYPEPSALGLLGIDFLDRLHLIWRISPTEARYSKKKENGQWNEYFIDSAAKEPGFITKEGIVFIDYWPYGGVKFLTNLSGTWERTGEIISCHTVKAVFVDSFGKLHVVYALYHQGTPFYYSLHYARLAIFNTVDENCDGR